MRIAKGVSVGPYRILSPIGAGGMGEVWRARDERIGRDVAVKVLPESFNQEAVKRFEQEARAAGSLSHPGLVTIFDVGTAGEWPYIVMGLLEGESLREAIGDGDTRTPLPPRKAIDYAAQAATALAVAHERGIIHRDLKPENLFVTPDRRVKILDFGLAKLAADATDADGRKRTSQHLTGAGFAVGTPAYMSPEQDRAARPGGLAGARGARAPLPRKKSARALPIGARSRLPSAHGAGDAADQRLRRARAHSPERGKSALLPDLDDRRADRARGRGRRLRASRVAPARAAGGVARVQAAHLRRRRGDRSGHRSRRQVVRLCPRPAGPSRHLRTTSGWTGRDQPDRRLRHGQRGAGVLS